MKEQENTNVKFVGQEKLLNVFERGMESGTLAHAYLLCANEGMGKTSFVSIISKALLCERPINGHGCGKCKSCLLFEANNHPDLIEFDEKGKKIKVEMVRQAISDLYIKPSYSERKVIVMHAEDLLNAACQNCLLKTLEEPPSYAVIIITTTNSNSLLDTVRSRSIILNFEKYNTEQIKQILKYNGVDEQDVDPYTAMSGLNPGVALKFASDTEFINLREAVFDLLNGLIKKEIVPKTFLDLFESHKENAAQMLNIMQGFFRDVLYVSQTEEYNLLLNTDKKGMILRMESLLGAGASINCIEIIENAKMALNRQGNFSLVIDALLIKLQEEFHK